MLNMNMDAKTVARIALRAFSLALALATGTACTTDICLTPRSQYTPPPKKHAAKAGESGPSLNPEEIYTALTGEAKGASKVRLKLQFTLANDGRALSVFQRNTGKIPDIVAFVAGAHTTRSLGTEEGRARLAREIADNVNRQVGSVVVSSVRIVNITLTPAQ